jgi:hypothetical protein
VKECSYIVRDLGYLLALLPEFSPKAKFFEEPRDHRIKRDANGRDTPGKRPRCLAFCSAEQTVLQANVCQLPDS